MHIILFDGPERINLLPFTYTRPVAEIRVGILTLRQKWEHFLGCSTSTATEDYLAKKWPQKTTDKNLFINPSFIPNAEVIQQIKTLKPAEKLLWNEEVVAYLAEDEDVDLEGFKSISFEGKLIHIQHSYHIFSKNAEAIEADFDELTKNRATAPIPDSVFTVNEENIFIEKGAKLQHCSLNAAEGPIYIGKNAEIMEGSLIRGPFSLGNNSYLKLGAKIYGGTTIGPHCKVGGEVNNSVLIGYSNKGHDGFLGNSVLGEWCNIGADSNNSNLKNNYAEVRLWNYNEECFVSTGLQFCGLMMGDHSKCGINTMFNTGTVVGVSANIFGSGFPRNFIPSFSWGGSSKLTTYKTQKAFEVAQKVMDRRDKQFTQDDRKMLEHIFKNTKKYRPQ